MSRGDDSTKIVGDASVMQACIKAAQYVAPCRVQEMQQIVKQYESNDYISDEQGLFLLRCLADVIDHPESG
jgi:hypothetical protein